MNLSPITYHLKAKLGFTLIELLVVIAIIGILATIVLTNVQGVRERSRDYRRKADLNSIAQSLRLFYTDFKEFPTNAGGAIVGCVGPSFNNLSTCSWGSSFATTTATYMNRLPFDPQFSATSPITYQYERLSSDQYILVSKIENKSDTDGADSRTRCASAYTSFTGTKTSQDYVVCSE